MQTSWCAACVMHQTCNTHYTCNIIHHTIHIMHHPHASPSTRSTQSRPPGKVHSIHDAISSCSSHYPKNSSSSSSSSSSSNSSSSSSSNNNNNNNFSSQCGAGWPLTRQLDNHLLSGPTPTSNNDRTYSGATDVSKCRALSYTQRSSSYHNCLYLWKQCNIDYINWVFWNYKKRIRTYICIRTYSNTNWYLYKHDISRTSRILVGSNKVIHRKCFLIS